MSVTDADRLCLAATRLEPDQLDGRVTSEEPDQLRPDVPSRAHDGDADPLTRKARPAVRRDRCGRLETRAHGRARPISGGRLLPVLEGIGWTAVMTALLYEDFA
jgi:hypothetical protein